MAKLKQYIVKKHIMAASALDAIKKERNFKVDDVWMDEEWLKNHSEVSNQVGFQHDKK